MRIEAWSDLGCPWCYLGKRRLEKALAGFEHAGEVEVVWRSFQLAPSYPKGSARPLYEFMMEQTGRTLEQVRRMVGSVNGPATEEGLHYNLDQVQMCNTFDAHRLAHLAAAKGLGSQAHERLLHALLVEGAVLDDPETLVRLGAEIGVGEGETRELLAGNAFAEQVRADAREAQALGATGAPFFVVDRAYGIAGAQSVEGFASVLERAHERAVAAG